MLRRWDRRNRFSRRNREQAHSINFITTDVFMLFSWVIFEVDWVRHYFIIEFLFRTLLTFKLTILSNNVLLLQRLWWVLSELLLRMRGAYSLLIMIGVLRWVLWRHLRVLFDTIFLLYFHGILHYCHTVHHHDRGDRAKPELHLLAKH